MGYSYNADQAHRQWLDWAKQKTEDKQAAENAKLAKLSEQAQNAAAMDAATKQMGNPHFAAEFGRVMQSGGDPKLALSMGLRYAAQNNGLTSASPGSQRDNAISDGLRGQAESDRANQLMYATNAISQEFNRKYGGPEQAAKALGLSAANYANLIDAKAQTDINRRNAEMNLSSLKSTMADENEIRRREAMAYADKYNYENFTAPKLAQQQAAKDREKELWERAYKMRELGMKGGLDAAQRSTAYRDAQKEALEYYKTIAEQNNGLIPHPDGKVDKDGKLIMIPFDKAADLINWRTEENFAKRIAVATGGLAGTASGAIGGSDNTESYERNADRIFAPSTGSQSMTSLQSLGQMQPTPGQEYRRYGTLKGVSVPGNDAVYRFDRNGSPFFTNQGAVNRGPGFVPVSKAPAQPNLHGMPSLDTINSRGYQNAQTPSLASQARPDAALWNQKMSAVPQARLDAALGNQKTPAAPPSRPDAALWNQKMPVVESTPAFRGGQTDLSKLYDKFISLHKNNPQNEEDMTPSTGVGAPLPITLEDAALGNQQMAAVESTPAFMRKLYDKFISLHKNNPQNEEDITPSTGAALPSQNKIPQQTKPKKKFSLMDFSWMSNKPTGLNQYEAYRYFHR